MRVVDVPEYSYAYYHGEDDMDEVARLAYCLGLRVLQLPGIVTRSIHFTRKV